MQRSTWPAPSPPVQTIGSR
ncbi:MAG: hypothetical protein H0U59_02395 [Gemmatimonadaceae bacterium]|nr:hypothetical protein [Gemmatimonadaceae bacterium]